MNTPHISYKMHGLCFILTALIMISILFWDKNLGQQFNPTYCLAKFFSIAPMLFLGTWTLVKRRIHPDLFQLYGLILFFYSWYGTTYIHWTYIYAFLQTFIVLSYFSSGKLSLYFINSAFGLTLALQVISSQNFLKSSPTDLKGHFFLTTVIFYIICLLSHIMIFRFRSRIDILNEHFIMIGKRCSLLVQDMRSPLNRLLSQLQNLKGLEGAESLIKDTQKISNLLTCIEAISGPREEIKKTFRPFQWQELKEEITEDFTHYLNELKIDLEFINFQGHFQGNRPLFYRLFKALIINAVEKIGHQSQRSLITISLSAMDGFVVVKFTNTNSTIAKHHLSDVFNPYVSSDLNTFNKGIGLYIVKQIVMAHDGSISVVSQHHATTFLITLPTPYP